MSATLAIMAAAALIAAVLAAVHQRRHRYTPTMVRGEPPTRIDRGDFHGSEIPWLIAVFTSSSCSSCAAVCAEMREYEGADVVVDEIEVSAEAKLHRKYGIESVPTSVVADAAGEARLGIVGPIGPEERQALAATLATNG